jgi:SNF2 family DNA or RNA helicase
MSIMIESIQNCLENIEVNKLLSPEEIAKAKVLYQTGSHVILSESANRINLLIESGNKDIELAMEITDSFVYPFKNGKQVDWNVQSLAALFLLEEKYQEHDLPQGMRYTREGMKKRVMEERKDRAKKADYKIKLSENLYGEHRLINEYGKEYKITLWDFDKKLGYINNIDWKTNKLGTTKHIMFLFDYLEENPAKTRRLRKEFPFIEVYANPLDDYRISWFFPGKLTESEQQLLNKYFGNKHSIEDHQMASFFPFLQKSADFGRIKIREEVLEKIEAYFSEKELQQIESEVALDYSFINASLYPYQKEGVAFATFKKAAIIADEMGLGKTLQAITAAIQKKNIFGFRRTLVICPASVKHQWKNEIEKFTEEKALVVEGMPDERKEIYYNNDSYFHIINYETVLRDKPIINKVNYDLIILDEAQKIKNYETKTANAVKGLHKTHGLVITGTPLENKLLELYSIVQFLDIHFLAPQWEFSYQHCIFDSHQKNKIQGYYNLQNLKERLKKILIRREKGEVMEQLPNVVQQDVFVELSPEQANKHAGFARGVASILRKKFKTPYDWQKLMLLLGNMRMVCDSTYLIDKQTHHSPKLVELNHILLEKLDVKNTGRKVIIFSEWVTMLNLIAYNLKKEGLTFTMLSGKVPVKKRGALIKEFEDNPDCSIFLSSEAGGTGLNLQVADSVINFELPWNPAKKNQRIGRINRIGQKKQKLHVFNLISNNSIEMKIATGLILKQNLFEGVLSPQNKTDEVDFNNKGKSQFIQHLEEVFEEGENEISSSTEYAAEESENKPEEDVLQDIEVPQPVSSHPTTFNNPDSENSKQDQQGFEEMEAVMGKGMDFLAGMYKMSTGKELATQGKPKINVNKETGEVAITFKIGT